MTTNQDGPGRSSMLSVGTFSVLIALSVVLRCSSSLPQAWQRGLGAGSDG